jgi:hypothetical protein
MGNTIPASDHAADRSSSGRKRMPQNFKNESFHRFFDVG